MRPAYDSILKIGSQELIPVGDSYRFVIQETMPHTGCKFKFGIRDKVLDVVLRKGKRLSVTFSEHPEIEFTMNPLRWMSLGEEKAQVGLFKKQPMRFLWYNINFRNEIEKPVQEKLFV